ncbi:putative LRR receptor-like serine/threonine-protein kinase, partial [Drosera capensis]
MDIILLLGLVLLLLCGTGGGAAGQQHSQIPQPLSSFSEKLALIQLRSSLGIRAKDWPIKADPCSIWRGIHCRNGTVVGINVSGFRRTRIGSENPRFAVDALGNLTRLESFNASAFALPGQIPEFLGQKLPALQVLDLGFCSIVGVIPSSLENSSGLRVLILSDNGLEGTIPSKFGRLRNLSVLDLSRNNLTGSIPSGIGNLSGLQSLNLSGNGLSSSLPSDFTGLKNLQKMAIGDNGFDGVLPDRLFADLTQLEVVDLKGNNFSGAIPDTMWSLPLLRFVDLSGNNFTGTLPNVVVAENVTTATLNLSNNQYYGNLTSVLQRFSSLDLSGNFFEGNVPEYVRNNASLGANCLQNVAKQRTTVQCAAFYATKGLKLDDFGLPTAVQPRKRHKHIIILVAVLGGAGLLLLLFVLLVLCLCARRRGGRSNRGNGVGPMPPAATMPPSPGVPFNLSSLGETFTYQQLLHATSEFSDAFLIKHGHSGDLYRGLLEGEIPVVIKRIDMNTIKEELFLLELDFLSKVSHHRLVPLLGHCLEIENEKHLVYKYMPNGDLSSSLFKKINPDDDSLQSLDWITRLKTAIGAAEGLSYLHHECLPPFVHRDVQASSILLDDKFEVRLGSLSEVCAQEGDTHQSVVTRFLRLPQTFEPGVSGLQTSACTYDVYCFGKVLLELVTGRLGMSASNDANVKEWLDQTLPYISIYDKDLITKIIDPSLIVEDDLLEEVWAMAVIARSCLNPKPSRRPLMRYILKALENPLKMVREEYTTSSARLRTTSSRSWNASLFGSWRQSSSDAATTAPVTFMARMEGASSLKRVGESRQAVAHSCTDFVSSFDPSSIENILLDP